MTCFAPCFTRYFPLVLLIFSLTFTFALCPGLLCLLLSSWVRAIRGTRIRSEGWRKERMGYLLPAPFLLGYMLAVVTSLYWRHSSEAAVLFLLPSSEKHSCSPDPADLKVVWHPGVASPWWSIRCWLFLICSTPLLIVLLLNQLWVPF